MFGKCHYTPAQRSWWGYIGFTPFVRLSVRPSARPSVPHRVRSVAPTVLVGPISYSILANVTI